MPKTVTIQAPAQHYGKLQYVDITGTVAHLDVGPYRHKFLIQETLTGDVYLTDYASGLKLGSLRPRKIAAMRSYAKMPDREAAKLLLEKLVAKHGALAVMERLLSAKTIN